MDTKTKNTDELFAYFEWRKKRAEAETETPAIVREIAVKSADESEWYTIHSILAIDAMREIYDTTRVAERCDELHRAIQAKREARKAGSAP